MTVGFPLLLAPGRAAHGDIAGDIAALTAALPACDPARAHCIGIRLHVTVGEATDSAADYPTDRAADHPTDRAADHPTDRAADHAADHPPARAVDRLIAEPAWFAVQLAAANRHFAPLDVAFQVVGIDTLPASAARIATREQRDAVSEGRLAGKVIHVFITGHLDDIDAPGAIIRGVTW